MIDINLLTNKLLNIGIPGKVDHITQNTFYDDIYICFADNIQFEHSGNCTQLKSSECETRMQITAFFQIYARPFNKLCHSIWQLPLQLLIVIK